SLKSFPRPARPAGIKAFNRSSHKESCPVPCRHFLKRHLRVRVLSAQPRSPVSAALFACVVNVVTVPIMQIPGMPSSFSPDGTYARPEGWTLDKLEEMNARFAER